MKEVLKKTIYLLILVFIIYIVINKLKKIDIEKFSNSSEFNKLFSSYEINYNDFIIVDLDEIDTDPIAKTTKEKFLKDYEEIQDNEPYITLIDQKIISLENLKNYYSNLDFAKTSLNAENLNKKFDKIKYKIYKKIKQDENFTVSKIEVKNDGSKLFSNSVTPQNNNKIIDLDLNFIRYKFNIAANSEIYNSFTMNFNVNKRENIPGNNDDDDYIFSTDYEKNSINDQQYQCKAYKVLTMVTNKINESKNFLFIYYIELKESKSAYYKLFFLKGYPENDPEYTIVDNRDNMDFLKDYLREPTDTKKFFSSSSDTIPAAKSGGTDIFLSFTNEKITFSNSKKFVKTFNLPGLKYFENIIFNNYSLDMKKNPPIKRKALLNNDLKINNFSIQKIENETQKAIIESKNVYKIPTVEQNKESTSTPSSNTTSTETQETDKDNTFNNNPVINISYYTNNYTNEQDNSRTSIKPYNNIQDIKYNKVTGLPENNQSSQTTQQVDASMLRRDGAYLSDYHNNDLRFYSSNLNKILNDKNSDYCPIVMESDYGLFQANNN